MIAIATIANIKYELLFIVSPTLEDTDYKAVQDRVAATLKDVGGKITKSEKWEKRKLAYEIDGNSDGIYTLIEFEAPGSAIAELDRILRITDAVLRHTVVKQYVPGQRALAKAAKAGKAMPSKTGKVSSADKD